jgi:hypothetical protein
MGPGNDWFGSECHLTYVFTVCIIVKTSIESGEANSPMLAYRLAHTVAYIFQHRRGPVWWNVHLFLGTKTTAILNHTQHRNTRCNTAAKMTKDWLTQTYNNIFPALQYAMTT